MTLASVSRSPGPGSARGEGSYPRCCAFPKREAA